VGSLHEAGVQQEFLEAVSALRNLNKEIEVTAVFCDQQLTQNVKEQLEINGIHRVLFYKRTENPISFQQLAKQWYKHFSSEHLDVIVFTESSWTTQLASRLAVHYDTKAIFDVVALSLPEQGMYVFERRLPGQRIQAVEISD